MIFSESIQRGNPSPNKIRYNWGSDCEYCSLPVMVKKRDKIIRLCTDYRRLNAVTKPDHVPKQDPQALLSQISESKYFSKLDLTTGYYQMPVQKQSRQHTEFQTSENTYIFNYLPFGLYDAPATFVRLTKNILRKHKMSFITLMTSWCTPGHLKNTLPHQEKFLRS